VIFGRNKRAAVLGCGPAGLFAAHALAEKGWEVSIFSKKRKSHMFGAQYLHAPIPGLTVAGPVEVTYRLTGGTAEDYRQKVYGTNAVVTSVESLERNHLAWDIREAYDNAWERYSPIIRDQVVDAEFLGILKFTPDAGPIRERTLLELDRFDWVVSSIPAPDLCYRKEIHQFHGIDIWAMGDAPQRGQYAPYRPPANTVECNASTESGWYRASNVFAHTTVEWPGRRKPPLLGVASVTKPIGTNCDCFLDGNTPFKFLRVGRYGEWNKAFLSHHSYAIASSL
jgi:hypothetical protein